MRALYGVRHAFGCSSGTAAVHIALGALAIEPGREVITSAITDMGSLTGVLYQLLIPRFADIEAFVEMGRRHGIPVIEDCAQAHHTMWKGRLVGTFAAVLTDRNDIEERIRLFIDTCCFRDGRKRNPYFLAPNYQMTEMQGAVANA